MFSIGQKVKRVVGADGCFPMVGNVAFVEKVIDEEQMTLQGCGGEVYRISSFIAEGDVPAPVAPEVHELIQALEVIDKWNRLKPTGQMISIEAHCAQDGGSVFLVGQSFDSNKVQDLFTHLVHEVSVGDFQAQLAQLNVMAGKMQ